MLTPAALTVLYLKLSIVNATTFEYALDSPIAARCSDVPVASAQGVDELAHRIDSTVPA